MANSVNIDQNALTASIFCDFNVSISSLQFRHLIMPEQIVIQEQTAPAEKSGLCCHYLIS